MKRTIHTLLFFFLSVLMYAQANKPALTENFSSSSQARSGIAMGGIGTGSIELRKDGNFYNWSIFNNYPFGTGPMFELLTKPYTNNDESYLFFLVRYQVEGEQPKIKLLQSNKSRQEGGLESIIYYYPWMDAISNIQYSARFPFSNLVFTDPEMPFEIELEAFSPFIPHDVKNSSLPGAYFNFKVTSKTDKNVDVMLLGSLRNLVGYNTIHKAFDSKLINEKNYKFFVHSVTGMPDSCASFGQMGLGVIGGDEVSYYLGWEHKHPYYEKLLVENKLADIDDTKERNYTLENKLIGRFAVQDNDQRCFSSIAVSKKLKGNSNFSTSFFMNWDFPNNYGAVEGGEKKTLANRTGERYSNRLKVTKNRGHYYQNSFSGLASIVPYFVENQFDLSKRTHQFVDDMYASDIDQFVLDQINSHLNTFITSSTLTKNGQFGIREGLTPNQSWGPNATMDVALYGSPMVIALFPTLQKASLIAHKQLQTKDGEVNHGLGYDLGQNQNGTWGVYDRVDLVSDYIQMVLRDYLWTHDKAYIKEMWPSVKKGIEYVLTKRDKDGDQMPDMEGIMCSYDNFPMYGLASYIQSQWIAALTMAAEVATDMGEKENAQKYKKIALKGSKLMEEKLWNGSYFNLSNDYLGKKGIDNGCLTDQLIGQWVAHNTGLGYLFNPEHVKKSLKSIMNKSFMNNTFLRNCTWPAHPVIFPIESSELWVDQANTPWTGVELAFASFLIYENMVEEGLKVIKGVDDRYRKAGLYFDHQEFGGHYFRPMSAWSIMNAYLGFSINRGTYKFNPKIEKENFTMFFVTPSGTAFYKKEAQSISLEVRTGNLEFSELQFENSKINKSNPKVYIDNKILKTVKVKNTNGNIILKSTKEIKLSKEQVITIK